MSYIENLLGNPVLPEVQESLGLAAGNYKIRGFNIFILGSYAILSEGLALIDGLRVVSSANLQLPTPAVYSKYVFLRIRTFTEVVEGDVIVQEELSLVAQTSNIPVNNDNLYEGIGTKDVLLAYVNSSGVVNLATPGALIYYDVPSRILDLENDIKVGLSKGYWASYFDNTTQVSNLVVKPVEYNSTYFQYGISCVDKTKIRFNQAGTFDVHFSFVVENTTKHELAAEFWFRVNGTDLANTNTRVTLLKEANTIASWNFIHEANIGDEFQIMWYAPSGVQLRMYPAETEPTRPLVPSTIITITQVLYNQKSVPTGGTAGQVLAKIDGTDYNTQWVTKDTASLETRMTAVETKNTEQDDRLTALDTDTGWVNIVYNTGWSGGTGGQLQCRKIGNQVFLRGGVGQTVIADGNYKSVATGGLPPQFRPPTEVRVTGMGSSGRSIGWRITVTGNIDVNNQASNTNASWASVFCSWLLD